MTLMWMPEFDAVVGPVIQGQCVWDLGCGFDTPALRHLIRLGARKVELVDKDMVIPRYDTKTIPLGIHSRLFQDLHLVLERRQGPDDVAFVSWPHNSSAQGLEKVVAEFKTVIYVGCNSDGTACGDIHLWRHLATRNVQAYLPRQRNSLIVYGPQGPHKHLLEEEWAQDHTQMHDFIPHDDYAPTPTPVFRLSHR